MADVEAGAPAPDALGEEVRELGCGCIAFWIKEKAGCAVKFLPIRILVGAAYRSHVRPFKEKEEEDQGKEGWWVVMDGLYSTCAGPAINISSILQRMPLPKQARSPTQLQPQLQHHPPLLSEVVPRLLRVLRQALRLPRPH